MTGCTAAGAALFVCLAQDPRCLPDQHRHLLPLILSTVRQESNFTPWVVRNERERKPHYFPTKEAAIAYAIQADARGDVLGLGPGQMTWRSNWKRHTGLDGAAAIIALMDPCTNLRATAAHYGAAYNASVAYNAGPGRVGNPPAPTAAYAMRVVSGASQIVSAAPTPVEPPPPNLPAPRPLLSTGQTSPGQILTFGRRTPRP